MSILKHLMGSDQFTLQGAVRRATWLIGQAPERSRWIDMTHLKGRFFALPGLRYVSLVVNQTTAHNVPCQQTRKNGQMLQYRHDRL